MVFFSTGNTLSMADRLQAVIHEYSKGEGGQAQGMNNCFLCPFAVYYLRYAVRSFFTMSRISLADGKRAGQKVQRKIPSTFCPALLKSEKNIVKNHSC
jgi:hypothetical protein